ncbi:MAG: hypothetical protein MI922_21465 [Bacteroidales bacterium]|nr:hypothetical protein [Bacteroidales bacterium]
MIEQKTNYIHNNPAETGFIIEPYYWKYSSAANFAGELGVMEIDEI